jgi:hypothetical protein
MSYAAVFVHTFLFIYINFKVVFKNPNSRPVINAALSSTSTYDVTCNPFEQDVVCNKITQTFRKQKLKFGVIIYFKSKT